MRRSGILLPVSSIPSEYGIGTFGKKAYEFVDFLKASGQKLWQILPLGQTGYGDSPYQSFSTFAGNPYFIDLEELIEEGLLTKEECDSYDFGTNPEYVDYEKVYLSRYKVLRKAYDRALAKGLEREKSYLKFESKNEYWLQDYALYMAVKDSFGSVCWIEWDEDIRLRKRSAIKEYTEKLADEIGFYKFQQYMFAKQWKALKEYANEQGVLIVGDIPIYVAFDSADTWGSPELFQLDEENLPIGVAGCPPDAFSETGQLWGNPLYAWDYHEKTDFDWWMKRIAYCYELYDIVRIDHFRGFDEYWFVPYGDETAVNGHWTKGPGYKLFETMKRKLGDKAVIAEDLGFLTDSVIELVEKCGFPGMKILEFAFGTDATNEYLPHNYKSNCIVYTGTHDNETIMGWYESVDEQDRTYADEYLGIKDGDEVNMKFIASAFSSVAETVVIPMQDYLGLGNEARINTPSTLGGNWEWRMKDGALTGKLAATIYKMTKNYGRL
ncbi:MAG: 4-alpha-glucanotransferase [Lachnospiraceae bacterium]|nr:4-alpha-glucanotransferase [Lachnospiraceae bacterium]